MSNYIHDKRSS